jgi:hypothetical protein
LFALPDVTDLFSLVFSQAQKRYVFEVRALKLEDDRLTFYIMPADGFQLPEIMKWIKQVFAQRFNGQEGRLGHVWGDRYWSKILEGAPPAPEGEIGVRPRCWETAGTADFLLIFHRNPPFSTFPAAPRPG